VVWQVFTDISEQPAPSFVRDPYSFLFSSIGVCVVMLVVCFSAWGEGFFLAVQTAIIGALVPLFGRSAKEALLFTVSYLVVCVILRGGYTPVSVLWSLQALNVPIICVSKVSVYFGKIEITL
jgi:hypothetical protein